MEIKKAKDASRAVSFSEGGAAAGGEEGTPSSNRRTASRRDSGVGSEPMRADADPGYAGVADDDGVRLMIEHAADSIARAHPSYQERKDSVMAKLKAAVEAL